MRENCDNSTGRGNIAIAIKLAAPAAERWSGIAI